MSLATIRAAMKTRLETVPAIGVVHDWDPLATTRAEFETYFKSPLLPYELGWAITREATVTGPHTMRKNLQIHQMVTRGYRGLWLAAESEKAFQDLVEAVTAAYRIEQDAKLGGAALQVGPPQVRIVEPRLMGFAEGSGLVHYAEIGLEVGEAVTFG